MLLRRIRLLLLIFFIAAILFALSTVVTTRRNISAESLGADPAVTLEPVGYLPVISLEPTATPSCVPPPAIPSGDLANEAAIQSGITQRREQNGLGPLNLAQELVQAARRHSLDMAANDFTGHTGSDGSSHRERMSAACYEASWSGEIIGWGFGGNPASMLDWWMNSPAHKAMILSSNFEDFGAGYIRDVNSIWGHYWTVNFGARVTQQNIRANDLHACRYAVEGEHGGSSLTFLTADPCPYSR